MSKVVLASSNKNKVEELNELLKPLDWQIQLQTEFGVADAIEDGLTFVENSIIKARNACKHTGLPAIADDSGLVIDALNGRPGIYSARYAGTHGDHDKNIEKVLTELKDVPFEKRTARFVCVIVYMRHENDPLPIVSQGTWEGFIANERKGDKGFGYDPIFIDQQVSKHAAELSSDEKHRVSHRGKAISNFLSIF